jgi:hypothetical protein
MAGLVPAIRRGTVPLLMPLGTSPAMTMGLAGDEACSSQVQSRQRRG